MAGPLTQPILGQLERQGPDGHDPFWDGVEGEPMYYDREGYPLSLREWTTLFEYKPYQVVEQTDVGGYWVSTVWLGLNHGGGRIFETMVFEAEVSYKKPTEWFPDGFWYRRDYEQIRWCSEEEAQAGHWSVVEEVKLTAAAWAGP